MQIHSAGEDAIIVYLGEGTSPALSARVQQATRLIESALASVLVDLVPSYASVLVVYNPLLSDHLHVHRTIHRLLANTPAVEESEGTLVNLPVYYATESGPDLEVVADHAGLSVEDVIDLHQQQEYRVYAIGFAPGFAYLGEVDARIAAPRLSTPRQKVPRGAVAIADQQTAVYPAPSPGGWNLIGLCPQRMFDPATQPTMPVKVGDRVRFNSVSRRQYLDLGGEL